MNPTRKPAGRSRGAAIIAALLVLAMAASMGASLVRTMFQTQRQSQTAQWQLQTLWLLEAAQERAALRLRADAAYTGELWRPATAADAALAENDATSGEAEIIIEKISGDDRRRRVRVAAHFPRHAVHRASQANEIVLLLSPQGGK